VPASRTCSTTGQLGAARVVAGVSRIVLARIVAEDVGRLRAVVVPDGLPVAAQALQGEYGDKVRVIYETAWSYLKAADDWIRRTA